MRSGGFEGGRPADPGKHSERLAAVVAEADGRIFLDARIGSHPLGTGDPLADALERGRRYVAAGADCVYPIKAPPQGLAVLAGELGAPVNALCGAGSRDASPAALGEAGAARITFGGGLAARALAGVRDPARELRART